MICSKKDNHSENLNTCFLKKGWHPGEDRQLFLYKHSVHELLSIEVYIVLSFDTFIVRARS